MWFEINPKTDIVKMQNKIKIELEKAEAQIMKQANIDELFKNLSAYKDDLRYVFLLKNFKPELLSAWVDDLEMQIKHIEIELNHFYKEKEIQMQRKKSLDRQILLNGVNMNISKRQRKLQELKTLLMDEAIKP